MIFVPCDCLLVKFVIVGVMLLQSFLVLKIPENIFLMTTKFILTMGDKFLLDKDMHPFQVRVVSAHVL